MTVQLIMVALGFAAIGVVGIFSPARVFSFFGVPLETVDGRNEVRAVYGGMCLALAAVLLESPWLGVAAPGILITVMTLLTGMVIGRLISLSLEKPGLAPMVMLGVEVAGIGLLATLIDFRAILGV